MMWRSFRAFDLCALCVQQAQKQATSGAQHVGMLFGRTDASLQ
jgi:hypothetical protein